MPLLRAGTDWSDCSDTGVEGDKLLVGGRLIWTLRSPLGSCYLDYMLTSCYHMEALSWPYLSGQHPLSPPLLNSTVSAVPAALILSWPGMKMISLILASQT